MVPGPSHQNVPSIPYPSPSITTSPPLSSPTNYKAIRSARIQQKALDIAAAEAKNGFLPRTGPGSRGGRGRSMRVHEKLTREGEIFHLLIK